MITHVTLKDFQSWRRLDIELAPITMLVGAGNAGKSALVRAIIYALTNQGGDEFIRHGAAQTQVGLAFDNGLALLWTKRRGAGAVYGLASPEGYQEFTKTGQSVPPEIEAALGFRSIEVDKNYSVSPQFKDQHDPPFIVFESGSKRARILGKLTRLDVLVQAQVLCRRDRETEKKDAETLRTQVDYHESRIKDLPDVAQLKERYFEARAAVQTQRDFEATIEHAKTAIYAYQAARKLAGCKVGAVTQSVATATESVARFTTAQGGVGRHQSAVVAYADATLELDRAREIQVELEQQYASACKRGGVCEDCPWK